MKKFQSRSLSPQNKLNYKNNYRSIKQFQNGKSQLQIHQEYQQFLQKIDGKFDKNKDDQEQEQIILQNFAQKNDNDFENKVNIFPDEQYQNNDQFFIILPNQLQKLQQMYIFQVFDQLQMNLIKQIDNYNWNLGYQNGIAKKNQKLTDDKVQINDFKIQYAKQQNFLSSRSLKSQIKQLNSNENSVEKQIEQQSQQKELLKRVKISQQNKQKNIVMGEIFQKNKFGKQLQINKFQRPQTSKNHPRQYKELNIMKQKSLKNINLNQNQSSNNSLTGQENQFSDSKISIFQKISCENIKEEDKKIYIEYFNNSKQRSNSSYGNYCFKTQATLNTQGGVINMQNQSENIPNKIEKSQDKEHFQQIEGFINKTDHYLQKTERDLFFKNVLIPERNDGLDEKGEKYKPKNFEDFLINKSQSLENYKKFDKNMRMKCFSAKKIKKLVSVENNSEREFIVQIKDQQNQILDLQIKVDRKQAQIEDTNIKLGNLLESYKTSVTAVKKQAEDIKELQEQKIRLENENYRLNQRGGAYLEEFTPRPKLQKLQEISNLFEISGFYVNQDKQEIQQNKEQTYQNDKNEIQFKESISQQNYKDIDDDNNNKNDIKNEMEIINMKEATTEQKINQIINKLKMNYLGFQQMSMEYQNIKNVQEKTQDQKKLIYEKIKDINNQSIESIKSNQKERTFQKTQICQNNPKQQDFAISSKDIKQNNNEQINNIYNQQIDSIQCQFKEKIEQIQDMQNDKLCVVTQQIQANDQIKNIIPQQNQCNNSTSMKQYNSLQQEINEIQQIQNENPKFDNKSKSKNKYKKKKNVDKL
ncbi:hypothetical protein PPERSA_12705 [Pseudocohnilembus persalinus]|uniref:Uncharacterized protein n=1 Tax=Pseudocohnilembus persalinus TaxID=266149 RepID=A0A0V0QTL0_PSEPJ|nr:hypothetical protein PPERSA_12705 [Pseudocohnilembus persalinus]|eukprot:KRX05527.1 hypothetical protein PPERSA_12705 [Pseudocohnilembus persalinus]